MRQEDRTELKLSPFSADGRDLKEATEELIHALEHDSNLRHPRSFGFIPGPAQSVSWLGDMIAMAYNPHVGGWHLSPGARSTEKQVIQRALEATGLDANPHPAGLIVSGGSMGELTALTAARDAKVTLADLPKAVVYLTSQTHSSVC